MIPLGLAWACAARGPVALDPPAAVADLSVAVTEEGAEREPFDVVLTLTRRWEDAAFTAPLQDPVTTRLEPAVEPRPGTTARWFTGYRLSAHEEAGDTLVTYSLLVEGGAAPEVRGWWHEDHQEVPTTLWTASGTWTGGAIELTLTEVTDPGIPARTARVSGRVRPRR